MSIADFFFGRKQNSTNSRRSVKLNRNAVRTRTLSMEPLETRDLLSVTTGTVSYYNDIVAEYPEFNLPTNQDDINIITIDLDEGATELKLEDLKTAIIEAGTTTQSDLILVKTTATANSVTYTNNEDEITIDIDSTQYGSVTIIGWGEEKFTLDANHQCRVMTVSGSSTVVNLGGLTITGGNSSGSISNTSRGGGIYNNYGTLTVTNSTISGNTASGSSNNTGGGGVYNYNGTVTVIDSSISGNRISVRSSNCGGGGIYNYYGTFTVTNSAISNNLASGSASSISGGGIYNYNGTFTATNIIIAGNITSGSKYSSGGGIYNSSGFLILTNCMISENTASVSSSASWGGGVYNYNGTITVANSTISRNTASESSNSSGGGFYNGNNGTLTILNSTISGNAALLGGGIYGGPNLKITNCTISGNTAELGGGVYGGLGSSYTVINSIVSINYGNNIYGGLSLKSSNNLIGDYYPGFVCSPVFSSDGKLTNADTIDLHLRSDSIAINMGDNSFVTNYEIDIAGNARIYDGTVDIGAYEYQGDRNDEPILYSTVVNTLNDSFDLNDDEWSLREAIYYAQEYVTITFADELEGTVFLSLGQLDIEAPLVIDGNKRIIIDGCNKSRIFNISTRTQDIPVVLNGLTIQNGKNECARHDNGGGGIYNYYGNLSVTNCTISENISSSMGGGIYNDHGTVTVKDSEISSNIASSGGGLCNYYGNLTIANSTISGNTSLSSDGGGIGNYYETLTLINCTISGNIASSKGGGIYDQDGLLVVSNSIISRNYNGNVFGNLSSNSSNNLIGDYYPGFVCGPVFSSDGKLANADTIDLHLRSDSIAINMGDNSFITNYEIDIEGNVRIYDGTVDIGAYEYQGDRNDEPILYSAVVNTLNDSFDLNDDEWSLREAIYYAQEYVTITFADELEGTVFLSLGQLDIEAPLAIDGKNRIIIDGCNKSRVFCVSTRTEDNHVVLNGLTIQNGNAFSSGGGGINNYYGNLSITNCTISGNTAYYGGGIYIDGRTGTTILTVTNSMISGNNNTFSGDGAISTLCYNDATIILTITNSTISDNVGDGIHCHCNSGGNATITVTNCTITYNARYGIYNYGTINVYNTIVACNTSNDLQYSGTAYGNNNLSSYTGWHGNGNNIKYDPNSPLFVNVAKSDYRLAANSQAIDMGNNQYALEAGINELSTDLAGNTRLVGTNIDIGAYEYDSCTTLPIPKTSIFIKYSTQVFGVNIYPVDNATGYLIEYSLYEDFSDSVIIDAQVGENELVAFQKPQSCYWRIKTLGDNLNYLDSDYSAIRSISLNVPLRDILLSTNTPEVGTVIRATLTPADATAEYQWYCGETLIQGASDSTFTVTADQIGQTITCVATGINGYNNTVSATTESVPAITLDTPVISPLKTYNNTIVVANWSSVDNANSYMFEYQRDGADKWTAISGLQKTSASFIGELGQTYNVRIKAIGTGIYTDSAYSQVQTVTIVDTLDAHNDFVKTTFNSPVVIDYRENDDATDWTVVTVQFGEASHGEYVVNEDGTISYTPESGFFGTDTIGYVLFSPSGKASVGSISISVGLPIATSVQKTSSSHSPSTAMAPSVDSLTDWENCCIELWAQGVNELNSGETTVTLEYNPAVYEVPYFFACAEGVALAASEGVVLPNGNVEIQLTVQVLEPIESLTDNLFLGTVVLTPSEDGYGVEDGSNVPACVLEGVELTTSVETMPYDMNHNGAIDVNDFVSFATVFGTNLETMSPDNPLYAQAVKADFNKDGIVNVDDFVMFAIKFGATKKRVEIPAAQASAAAESGNREWEVGNGEDIDSQVETPVAQSAAPASQLVTRNSQLEVESSMTLLEAYSAALLDLYDNQESFDQTDPGVVLAESRTESPVASYSDGSSQNTSFDAVDAVLEEDLLTIDWA